jgi:hypothetical protein
LHDRMAEHARSSRRSRPRWRSDRYCRPCCWISLTGSYCSHDTDACCSSHQPTNQTVPFRLRDLLRASQGACVLVVVGCSWMARLSGVRVLGQQRRRCGRVRAAWVLGLCVQSSVMSALLEIRIDNDQFMISERAEPACNHPFDSIQRADSHSTHVASTISLWGLDVVEFPQCVWTVTFLNLEQMQNGKFLMNIISALMQQPW